MKFEELVALDLHVLTQRGLDMGLGQAAYDLPPAELARRILIRAGETVDLDSATLAARMIALEERMEGRMAAIARGLRSVEDMAAKARWLAEAAVMSRSDHRVPKPEEIAALSEEALAHLTTQLGVASGSRAEVLEGIAAELGWDAWKQPHMRPKENL